MNKLQESLDKIIDRLDSTYTNHDWRNMSEERINQDVAESVANIQKLLDVLEVVLIGLDGGKR